MMNLRSASPLRYPGGKAKLYNRVEAMITANFSNMPQYVEPFAGGSALSIKLLFNSKVSHVHINDFDHAIWCVWNAILNDTENFIKLIQNTSVTIEEWHKQKDIYLHQERHTNLAIGFATFFLNRTNRSGIIFAGPIGGLKQDGNYRINSRYNKANLINLIRLIASNRNRISLYEMNAADFIAIIDQLHNDLFIYLDPPYVQKGAALYWNAFAESDHRDLAVEVAHLRNKWMMTYDPHPLVKNLYKEYNIIDFTIRYSVDKAKMGYELAIFSDNIDFNPMLVEN